MRARTPCTSLLGAGARLIPLVVACAPPAAMRLESAPPPPPPTASQRLWDAYVHAPDTHPNIPNGSYAGYHASERRFADPPVVATVHSLDVADETAAFQAALDEAGRRGGGAVLVPEGTHRLAGMLRITHSGVVLRGASAKKTVLVFTKSLAEILGPRASWSFSGGLLWVSPASDFLPTGKLVADYHDDWVPDDVIAGLKEPAKRGDTTITVRGAQNLAPGQYVFLGWKNLPDYSLLAQIAGPPAMNAFPWAEAKELTKQYRIFWPVQIAAVDGARVTLAQPLRLDVRPEWDVSIKPVLPYIEEVGVEHLTVRMESGPPNEHLEDKGFNAVFFSKVIHGWVDDVILENVDNGILLRSTKHVTARDFVIRGDRPHHHGTSAANSFDALFTDFRIESRPRHGISSEWLSSGNVWRRGTLLHGTFDLHSVMPYELIRTNIRVHNDGVRGGGKADGGPLQGARVVHWNIDATGKGELVNQPDVMPSGALVGVRGVPLSRELGPGDVPGDKSCVVADEGLVPSPVDLFEAELELRLKRSPCDVIHCGAVAQ